MKQEAIQNFLSLPGLAGVALMDGRSRPYFHGFQQTLSLHQREALAQGIQQVIDTTPPDFQSFEFRFREHQVHVYKLEHNMTFLVMLLPQLIQAVHAIRLQAILSILKEESSEQAIAIFQSFALQPSAFPVTAIPTPLTTLQPPTVSLKETLVAINRLSKLATQYLGTIVVINYWKNSRPEADWLKLFQIERTAQLIFSGQASEASHMTLEQHQWLQDWVAAFIKRCSKVIRDFPKLVSQMPDEQQKAILPPKIT
jgi:hypothetical protein